MRIKFTQRLAGLKACTDNIWSTTGREERARIFVRMIRSANQRQLPAVKRRFFKSANQVGMPLLGDQTADYQHVTTPRQTKPIQRLLGVRQLRQRDAIGNQERLGVVLLLHQILDDL